MKKVRLKGKNDIWGGAHKEVFDVKEKQYGARLSAIVSEQTPALLEVCGAILIERRAGETPQALYFKSYDLDAASEAL